MSEFKLTGDFYISEWNGNSLNDGTNPETPYAHPADLSATSTNETAIVSGFFKGSGHKPKFYTGDGVCVFDLLGGTASIRRANGFTHKNIYFKNGTISANGSSGNSLGFENCIFENINFVNSTTFLFYSCVFLSSPSFTQPTGFTSCIVLDSVLGDKLGTFNYSYLPASKKINFVGSTASLTNNCINGLVNVAGVDYELKKLFDGSVRPDANPLIPDLATASGFSDTYTTRKNFAGNANNIDTINKLVNPDSDLLKNSGVYGYIGSVKPARNISVDSISSDVTIETTQIDTTNSSDFIIEDGEVDGEIIITWKTDTITEVQAIFLDALLAFDGSEVGGTTLNNNVPDIFPTVYSPTTDPGMTPNRLLFAFRTSQSIAKPTTEGGWDNDNATLGTTAGAWYVHEWNTKPTIHASLGNYYGNGNPESIGISGNGINARWRQVKVRLTNLRSFA